MPQICKVCTHANREAIDAAILKRDSLRVIGAQYGVSKDSLSRHSHAHLAHSEPRQPEPQSNGAALQDRYRSFVERFSGGRGFSMAEVRSWGYSDAELDIFVRLAIERGELSRRTEPRQVGGTIAP